MAAAAESAATAFKTWRHTPVSVRQRVFFRLQELITKNEARIVDAIVRENGKTVTDAKGDVFRGLEVVEYACGISSQLMGETIEGVSKNVDTYSWKQPLGVAAGICPFNFPGFEYNTTCFNLPSVLSIILLTLDRLKATNCTPQLETSSTGVCQRNIVLFALFDNYH